LAHLDGILEDKRTRIKTFFALMNHFKNPVNVIEVLNSFLHKNTIEDKVQRDIASHLLALLTVGYAQEEKFEKIEQAAKEFLNWIVIQSDIDRLNISINAYTFALMTLLKCNDLAEIFVNGSSFNVIGKLLEGPCLSEPQIAYNVVTTLWILSAHEYSQQYFEDYNRAIIEKVSKILDYFNTEKVVRIMLMLFDSLKEVEVC
jgi:hypothetical protein